MILEFLKNSLQAFSTSVVYLLKVLNDRILQEQTTVKVCFLVEMSTPPISGTKTIRKRVGPRERPETELRTRLGGYKGNNPNVEVNG